MTTSRIVRGTKARIFLYICGILIITGIIACYNNTLSQLEDARKSSEICHQQEENLSTQLQVISDYKQRLEKSLKTEKAEHQQMKNDLENKLNEQKSKNEKSVAEVNLRLASLQQHFNLLQTQHDDFKEECSKVKKEQLNEVNDLKAKLSEVQEELKKVEQSKENLKNQFLQVQVDKENFQKQLHSYVGTKESHENEVNHLTKLNQELSRELAELKGKCSLYESIQPPQILRESSSIRNNFSGQYQISPNEYQINAMIKNKTEEQLQVGKNRNFIKAPTKSTTSSSLKVSQGSLNDARPLLFPTVTPETINKSKDVFSQENKPPETLAYPLSYNNINRLPEGVVPVPEKPKFEKNEIPINNRYESKINEKSSKDDVKKNEEVDKENVANEVFDQPHNNGAYDALGFGELNDVAKHTNNKQHIDHLGVGKDAKNYEVDYKDNQNDMQLEENDPEDDDPEDYGDRLGRLKDPVVRN